MVCPQTTKVPARSLLTGPGPSLSSWYASPLARRQDLRHCTGASSFAAGTFCLAACGIVEAAYTWKDLNIDT